MEEVGEVGAARAHWASQGRTPFYEASQHWRQFMAERISWHAPKSVLEFGCNAGRNLVEVRKRIPGAILSGIDVNAEAVAFGAETYSLDLRAAGEEHLATFQDRSVDVTFTVSVLDHIPAVESVFNELARISRTALLLLEPYTGKAGRADTNALVADGGTGPTTRIPFTYAWDYHALSRRSGDDWFWRWAPYPLSSQNMGPHYWLIEGIRRR